MSWNKVNKVDLVLDIETVGTPIGEDEKAEALAGFIPPKNIKDPEKIEARRKEYEDTIIQKLTDKRAIYLSKRRPISCAVGIVGNDGKAQDIEAWASDDLNTIASGLCEYLNELGDNEFRIIGYNVVKFDLIDICRIFKLTGMRPRSRPSKWDIVDLSRHPYDIREFSPELGREKKLGLKEICRAFGIETYGDMDGSAVQGLYEAGDWETIKEYNKHDIKMTAELYYAATSIFSF